MSTILNNKVAIEEYQEFIDNIVCWWLNEAKELSKDYNISEKAARTILYLRTRSRWTQEKENYLIWLDHNEKNLPFINDDFEVPNNYKDEN